MVQQNPALASSAFNDPRMISVLGVLMGIDMQGFSGDEVPPEYASKATSDATASSSTPHATASASASASASTSTSKPPPPAEDVTMEEPEDEDAIAEKKAKEEALAEKAKGNDAYKKRKFDVAIAAFEKAWDLWPKDVTFLTNLSGACRSNSHEYMQPYTKPLSHVCSCVL